MLFIIFLLSFSLLYPKYVYANLEICGFSWFTTSDKVNICNTSSDQIDVSSYSLYDNSSSNKKTLSNIPCFLLPNQTLSISFSNYLNTSGDYILLKKGDEIIDCVSYKNITCPNINQLLSVEDNKCNKLVLGEWQIVDDCNFFDSTNTCLLPTNTPSDTPPIPSPSNTIVPTSAPSPSSTPSQIRLEVVDTPASAKLDSPFSISVFLKNAPKNQIYSFKPFDKLNASKNYFYYQCQDSNNWCHYTSAFADLPSFSTDSNGNLSVSLILRFDSNKDIPDDYTSQISVKAKNAVTDDWLDSFNIKVVEVIKPEANLDPTTVPTQTSRPTVPVSPSPSHSLSQSPTPLLSPQILGNTDYQYTTDIISFISPTATQSPASTPSISSVNLAPYMLIVLGGGLLFSPAIVSKFKKSV